MPLISALIVTYNPNEEFKRCIETLISVSKTISLEIIVLDNYSTNGYLETIQALFPQINFIKNDTNLGFGGGNNLAFQHSQGDYIICINPDLLITEVTLKSLLEVISNDASIGVIGPRTEDEAGELSYTARADYTVWRLCAKYLGFDKIFPTIIYGDYVHKMRAETQPFEVDWLQGSCLLMRRETYQAVDGFDEDFFLYMEDTDICRKIRELGLKVVYDPQSTVTHIGGTTTARFHAIRVKSYHHSPIHYHRKQGHPFGVWILKLTFMLELGAKIFIRTIQTILSKNELHQQRRDAEWQTLKQLWSY